MDWLGFVAVPLVIETLAPLMPHPSGRFPHFRWQGHQGRAHFRDIFKNFGSVGGFLLVVGGAYVPVSQVIAQPLASGPRGALGPVTAQAQISGDSSMADEKTGPKPKVPYWHVWTDAEGVSHQDRFELTEFDLKSMKPPADPQWQGTKRTNRTTVMVTVQPVGWTGEWHENPKPQWIIPLSGRWFVETTDGKRVEMGPGELSFGEDQNTKPDAKGRQGHLSGTVGDEPAVLMVVQIEDEPPTVNQPGRFK